MKSTLTRNYALLWTALLITLGTWILATTPAHGSCVVEFWSTYEDSVKNITIVNKTASKNDKDIIDFNKVILENQYVLNMNKELTMKDFSQMKARDTLINEMLWNNKQTILLTTWSCAPSDVHYQSFSKIQDLMGSIHSGFVSKKIKWYSAKASILKKLGRQDTSMHIAAEFYGKQLNTEFIKNAGSKILDCRVGSYSPLYKKMLFFDFYSDIAVKNYWATKTNNIKSLSVIYKDWSSVTKNFDKKGNSDLYKILLMNTYKINSCY